MDLSKTVSVVNRQNILNNKYIINNGYGSNIINYLEKYLDDFVNEHVKSGIAIKKPEMSSTIIQTSIYDKYYKCKKKILMSRNNACNTCVNNENRRGITNQKILTKQEIQYYITDTSST